MADKFLVQACFEMESVFDRLYEKSFVIKSIQDITKDSTVIFWGGEDICTSFYNAQPAATWTVATHEPSIRDQVERVIYEAAIAAGSKIIGICRGAQLVCALHGGSLLQHVNGHANNRGHIIHTNEEKMQFSNSYHHQMMNPFKLDHELVAWTHPRKDDFVIDAAGNKAVPFEKEPEVVWFPKIKALCIQGHPEYVDEKHSFAKYAAGLVEKYHG